MRPFLLTILMLFPLVASAAQQLSQREYQLLTEASKLIESEQYVDAKKHLMKAQEQVKSEYGQALLWQSLGHVELQRERYGAALLHLSNAHRLKALPTEQKIGLNRTLAQLNCMEEKWKTCLSYLRRWMNAVPEQVKGQDHLLLAQAYSQLEKWSKVVKPIGDAIKSRRIAPESWYQLKVVAHIRLKQYKSAIREQKRMMRHYANKARNWRQLVSLHIQNKDQRSALSAQRIGFERGVLRKAKDYSLLAQMMLQAEIPFYAGQVVQHGLENGVLKRSSKNLSLLSRAWIHAKEHNKAVHALAQLNRVKPTKKTLVQMAHIQMEMEDWLGAQTSLERALDWSKDSNGKLQLMLGIARIKLKDYRQARNSLVAAADDKQLKSAADSWVRYLDQIAPKQLQAAAG